MECKTVSIGGENMKSNLLKTLVALLCVLCLTLGALPALAAPIGGYGTIQDYALVHGTASLNLRAGPGTEYEWLGSCPEGTWVGVVGESGNWYCVQVLESGMYGYMSKNFLKSSGAAPGGGTSGVVNNPKASQFLNLRQYPSYSAPVLGIYYNGAVFQVLSVQEGWYQVMINGVVGYFRQEFVRINGYSGGESAYVRTPNGGKANLRSAPSYNGSSVISQVPNLSGVTVLLRSAAPKASSFWKVSVNGMTGYMDSTFLVLGGGGDPGIKPAPQPVPPTTGGYAIVNNPKATQFLNLRAQPSTSAKVIAQYKNGIRFEVMEQGETWCKVYGSASGNMGYIMTKYLKLYGLPAVAQKTVQNGSTYVNLRSAPSKQSGAVYQKVYSGAVVTVLTPGDEWTQVRYGSVTGYMMTCFLK